MNISDAYNVCHSNGTNVRLAILDTFSTFADVTEFLLQDFRYQDSTFWVSIVNTTESYVWTNNVTVEASFWSSGQPDGFAGCVALARFISWSFDRMLLYTESCDNNRTFALCQFFAAETGKANT